jgi:hypothetical protein
MERRTEPKMLNVSASAKVRGEVVVFITVLGMLVACA